MSQTCRCFSIWTIVPVISLEGPRCSGVKEEAALVDVMFFLLSSE
jgi:hypothetical protein